MTSRNRGNGRRDDIFVKVEKHIWVAPYVIPDNQRWNLFISMIIRVRLYHSRCSGALLYQEKSFWFNLMMNMTGNLMVDSLKENTSRQENNANLMWVAYPSYWEMLSGGSTK
jgi:hypothetical protein